MKIKKVEVKNIRSYKKEKIDFPEGSTVFSGDIGAGKTSILLAIEFALFGLQPGTKGTSLLRNGTDEGFVRLAIEVEGKDVVIERGLKRKGSSVGQSHSKITTEGVEEETSITELKNKVLSILNYPQEFARKTNFLYRFTVYTSQENMKQIIKERPEVRLNTLRHIFGIDKYKRIKENTKILTSKLRRRIRNYEGQIDDLKRLRDDLDSEKKSKIELNKQLEKLKKELSERKKNRGEFEKSLQDIKKKIDEKRDYENEKGKMKVMLANKKESFSDFEKEEENLSEQIENIKKKKFDPEEIKELKKKLEIKQNNIEEKNEKNVKLLGKINSLNSSIEDAKELKEQIASLRLCPTCLQDVGDDHKKNIIRKKDDNIAKYKRKIKEITQKRESVIENIKQLKENSKKLREEINKMQILKVKLDSLEEKENRLTALSKRKNSLKKDMDMLGKQMKSISEKISTLKKYENIHEKKKKELDELRSKERDKEIKLASTKKEIELTQKNIEKVKERIKEKNKIKNKLLEIRELEDWLSKSFLSIISFTERNIMLKLRKKFSRLFNDWFNILVPDIFTVRLDEDFTPVIEQGDYELDYSFLSGGERTAIALAYRLALNQVINSMLSNLKTKDLIILDEPTDGFSTRQLDKMRDIFSQLDVEQLLVVSHEDKIESFVENVIKFKKEGKVTKVIKG